MISLLYQALKGLSSAYSTSEEMDLMKRVQEKNGGVWTETCDGMIWEEGALLIFLNKPKKGSKTRRVTRKKGNSL